MKKMHLIGLIIIATAIGILMTQATNLSSYGDFARAMAEPDRNHQIVGHLVTEKPIDYDPKVDANTFSFYMTDEKGVEKKVVSLSEKPQDFERSEQIVLTGKMKGEVFVATEMQLKCPSKYQDEAIQNKTKGVKYN